MPGGKVSSPEDESGGEEGDEGVKAGAHKRQYPNLRNGSRTQLTIQAPV
jgi:hypothetical protein